jgi:hypothetical protein
MLSKALFQQTVGLALLVAGSACGPTLVGVTARDDLDGIPTLSHRIFISSTKKNALRGGVSGMDGWCQGLASAAGLQRTYKAVVSTSTESVASRLVDLGPVYVLSQSLGSVKVAPSISALWNAASAPLSLGVAYDEKQQYVDHDLGLWRERFCLDRFACGRNSGNRQDLR